MMPLMDEGALPRKRPTTYGRVHRKRPQDILESDESQNATTASGTINPTEIAIHRRQIAVASPPSKLKPLSRPAATIPSLSANTTHRLPSPSEEHPSSIQDLRPHKAVAPAIPIASSTSLHSPSDSDAPSTSPPKRRRLGVDRVTALTKKDKTLSEQKATPVSVDLDLLSKSHQFIATAKPLPLPAPTLPLVSNSHRQPRQQPEPPVRPPEPLIKSTPALNNSVLSSRNDKMSIPQPNTRNKTPVKSGANDRVAKSRSTSPRKVSTENQTRPPILRNKSITPLKPRPVKAAKTSSLQDVHVSHALSEDDLSKSGLPSTNPTAQDSSEADSHTYSPKPVDSRHKNMWMNLFNDQDEDTPTTIKKSPTRPLLRTSQSALLPARKRLIDTLVDQSRDSTPAFVYDSDSSAENDSSEAPESQTSISYSQTIPLNDAESRPQRKPFPRSQSQNALSQSTGGRTTYSLARSMLAEQVLSEKASFETPLHDSQSLSNGRTRRGSIPALTSLPSFREIDEDDISMDGPSIRTIHELRTGGNSDRFHDEAGDLLDQISNANSPLSLRRSALLDLATKLLKKPFLALFTSHSMEQRLFEHMEDMDDIICSLLIASILLSMLDRGMSAITFSQLSRHNVSGPFLRLIDHEEAISSLIKDRKSNMSRMAQTSLTTYVSDVLNMKVCEDIVPDDASPKVLALKCIETMTKHMREQDFTGTVMAEALTAKLFSCLVLDEAAVSSEDIVAIVQKNDFRIAISALEARSTNHKNLFYEGNWIKEYLPILRETIVRISNPGCRDIVPQQLLMLRLALNVTNNNSNAADVFATGRFMESVIDSILHQFQFLSENLLEDEIVVVVDHVVLILGFLINLVEWSHHANECFIAMQRDDLIASLANVFVDNISRMQEALSQEDVHRNIPFGYLSVLLGYMCLMPATSNLIRGKVRMPYLIQAIEEFVTFNEKIEEIQDETDGHNANTAFTKRLQDMVNRLK